MAQTTRIKFPIGEATYLTKDAVASVTDTIWNNKTVIKITGLTEGLTVNLTPDSEIEDGAKVIVDVVQGATKQDITWGANMVAVAVTGVASDRDSYSFTYSATEQKFILDSGKSIDAA